MNNLFVKTGIIFLVFLLTGIHEIRAQSGAEIRNVDFYLENNKLIITYDIANSSADESFNIWIKIKTAYGQLIQATSLTGDISSGVKGGSGKRIVWDVIADNVSLDDDILIEVFARAESEEPAVVEKPEPEITPAVQKSPTGKKISVGKALLFSAILPGLGNTYVKGKGAAWLWGVLGYGCIVGSVVMNNMAYNNYEDYKTAATSDERDQLYDKASTYDLGSKVLIGAAATIWVVDLVITGIQAGKARKTSHASNIRLNYQIDPHSQQYMVGLTYKF